MLRSALRSKANGLAMAAILAVSIGSAATLAVAGGTTAPTPADGRLQLAQAAPATTPPAQTDNTFDARQKSAIQAIVKDYLLAHPEIMLEVQTALEEKMEKIQNDKIRTALTTHAAEIYRDAGAPVAGNPSGTVPVVEFFDYNCGYCRRAFSDISKLVDTDKNIKLILKELPILSKGSEEASRVALAAARQGKYWEVHRALIAQKGEANEQSALRIAEKHGLDMARLKKDMASPEIAAEIARVRALAQAMGIQGTPYFLVGDRIIAGAPTDLLAQIEKHAAEVSKTGCPVC